MAEDTLSQLSQSTATIMVGSASHQLYPITLGNLNEMLTLCAPLLQVTVDREDELKANFDNALLELVMQDVERFKTIVSVCAKLELQTLEEMSIDQLIFAVGVIIGKNPVFFSHLKALREKLKAQPTASQ